MCNLTGKPVQAIELLLSGSDRLTVCQELDIARKTLYNWMELAEFKRALEEGRRARLEQTANILSKASVLAAAKLVGVLEDEKASPSQKIRTAQTILGRHLRNSLYHRSRNCPLLKAACLET